MERVSSLAMRPNIAIQVFLPTSWDEDYPRPWPVDGQAYSPVTSLLTGSKTLFVIEHLYGLVGLVKDGKRRP